MRARIPLLGWFLGVVALELVELVELVALVLPVVTSACRAPATAGCRAPCPSAAHCEGETCVADGHGCGSDDDCDEAAHETCQARACRATAPSSAACTVTGDCPIDAFCNSRRGRCEPLHDGWCREPPQCATTTPLCSSPTPAVPGRCVECMTSADCTSGASCASPGVCAAGTSSPGSGPAVDTDAACQPNAIIDGSGACACIAGFIDGGQGACRPTDDGSVVTPCTQAFDCLLVSPSFTCIEGACACDTIFMSLFGCAPGTRFDEATCSCVAAAKHAANEACVVDGRIEACVEGLTCTTVDGDDGLPRLGACKQTCTGDATCAVGLVCAQGFLSDEGVCRQPLANGARGCGPWSAGDAFCFDEGGPAGAADARLECFAGACAFACEFADNEGGVLTCPPNTGTCGALRPVAGSA